MDQFPVLVQYSVEYSQEFLPLEFCCMPSDIGHTWYTQLVPPVLQIMCTKWHCNSSSDSKCVQYLIYSNRAVGINHKISHKPTHFKCSHARNDSTFLTQIKISFSVGRAHCNCLVKHFLCLIKSLKLSVKACCIIYNIYK